MPEVHAFDTDSNAFNLTMLSILGSVLATFIERLIHRMIYELYAVKIFVQELGEHFQKNHKNPKEG